MTFALMLFILWKKQRPPGCTVLCLVGYTTEMDVAKGLESSTVLLLRIQPEVLLDTSPVSRQG